MVPLKACWLNRTEMSCYFSHLSAVTDRGEFDESSIPGFPPLLGVGTVDICKTLIPGFPPILGVGTVDICCEQPTRKGRNVQRLPVPRLHPKKECQAQITNQIDKGRILQDRRLPLSLLPKDRITWDNQYIVHIYYIHIRTVVKEVNKGIRCANL